MQLARFWTDPFAYLGMHPEEGGVVVRASLPQAARAFVRARDSRRLRELTRIDADGLFELHIPRRRATFDYVLAVDEPGGRREIEDAYRFGPLLGDVDAYLIAEGTHRRLWDVLGAHPRRIEGVDGTAFAVWAPNARRVSVVGDFNEWDGRRHPMRKRVECGVWEIFVPDARAGARYKYEIEGAHGGPPSLKADPFARASELRPATASIVHAPSESEWSDGEWMRHRAARIAPDAAVSIYEVHAGSWRRTGDGRRFLTYRELAAELLPYVAELGFTHVELMPVTEHPFDGSWGYQPVGLFAPTSRFGTPDDFRAFVEAAHALRIGVVLDWVPGHFPDDPHGLAAFDGTHLYEHEDRRKGFHPDWNTLVYNLGRREVSNVLLASALFWIDEYHVDALRVDAVASMLYLDYSRAEGEWLPNEYGGRENLESIAFLRHLNATVAQLHPGVATIAEESTSWPQVTGAVESGGLGFTYKWNMGWMHDTLRYFARDPVHRRYHQEDLTFGLVYAFSERFVLPLSHDEVVHGKGSLLQKMPGDHWQQFANLRALLALQYAHPGKKLLFMGAELAQPHEWSHDGQLAWDVLGDALHAGVHRLVADCNRVYRSQPALHELDAEPAGFEWLDFADAGGSVIAFARRGRREGCVVAVLNATPVVRDGYRIGVPHAGGYRECINTDSRHYGGSDVGNAGVLHAQPIASHGRAQSLLLTLPPLALLLLASGAEAA
ncbi:MAG TPA: 1,4-alpha-glucan branching protein GlgB [Candidatus Tumulicola sp.]|nr:1,4-alpha-glucan branching protein GlgB [Candidatus Tumulicola sp.]